METPFLRALILLLLFQAQVRSAEAAPGDTGFRITVEAGTLERTDQPVAFYLPTAGVDPARTTAILKDNAGNLLPADLGAGGRVTFILPHLDPQQTARYQVFLTNQPPVDRPMVQAATAGSKVNFTVRGRPVLSYQAEPSELPRANIKEVFRRGGYLHPLTTPAGKVITDDYPTNHLHHHGVWMAWTKTKFEGREPDFWNMGESKGKVAFKRLGRVRSGSAVAEVTGEHEFVDLTGGAPKAVLDELWEVRVYPPAQGGKYFRFDLMSMQACATAARLELPKYYYGGIGFRGHESWNGPAKTYFLTSEGETNRVKGNETHGRWCYIGGMRDGHQAGIVLLCHPDNFRAPQPMRLHPTEPFFCFAPSQDGDWAIEPAKPCVSRYRGLIFDGPPNREEIDRLWENYAHPPKVTLE